MNSDKRKETPRSNSSHPVGTSVGAVGGAATGAAIGAAAGPIGAGVGLVAGAAVGAAAGRTAAAAITPEGVNLQDYIDYTVVDRAGEKIGTLDAVWADSDGKPAYLVVRTGWLGAGSAHLVPTQGAEVSESTRKLRVPYSMEQVKSAPSFASEDDIDSSAEERIAKYFRQHGFKGAETSSRMGSDSSRGAAVTGQASEARSQRQHAEDATLRLKDEQLKVGKREVEYGGVRLRKIVRTETVNQPIELKREEIVIERVPASGGASQCNDSQFNEREIYIPLRREEAVVAKETRVREEVRVGKKTQSEQRQVSESIRHEDVEIVEQGEACKTPVAKR